MKKRLLTKLSALGIAAMLACAPILSVSAANLGTDIDGTKVVFENPRLTSGDDHAWEGVGVTANDVTCANGEMTVTVPAGLTGLYYRPNSAYGEFGAFGEGGIAMKLKLTFQEAAAGDWGAMLLIRNKDNLSWNATNALSLYFYKNQVALWQAGVTSPLAVVYKPVKDAYYNVEFITDDLDDGTTTVYVLITDEQGNLLKNDGDEGEFTMKVEGVSTASIPAGFISWYTNSAELKSYSMKQGEWTCIQEDNTGDNTGDNAGDNTENNGGENTGNNGGENAGSNTGNSTEENTKPIIKYPSLSGVKSFNLKELGITTEEGLDKYWSPIGGVNYTINDAKNMITVTPATTEGLYFGPCSPYGGALEKSVAMAMSFGIDFKEGASDFGYMLILKGNDAKPSWGLSRGIVMMVYPNAIKLCKVQNTELVDLAVYEGSLESGKNYNLEFIAIDNSKGKTDAYLKITDEKGNVLRNSGDNNEVTLAALDIEGVAGEGYVTMFANAACTAQYRFGTGKFTAPITTPQTGDAFPVGMMAILAIASMLVLFGTTAVRTNKRR